MLFIELNLLGGAVKRADNILAFTLDADMNYPCSALTVTLPLIKGGYGEVCSAVLHYGNYVLFRGICDKQTESLSEKGAIVTLNFRSAAAVLCDNEAVPRTVYNPTLARVASLHAAKYGVKGIRGPNPTLSKYSVGKGVSAWQAVDMFCRAALGYSPRLDDDMWLNTTLPEGKGRTIPLSNLRAGCFNYTAAVKTIRRCEVISSVKVRSSNGFYTSVVYNKEDGGVLRSLLLNPTGEWANLPSQSAEEAIKGSMLAKTVVEVTLPDIVRCDIGDSAMVYDNPFDGGYYIGGVRYTLDPRGFATRLSLYDKRYV